MRRRTGAVDWLTAPRRLPRQVIQALGFSVTRHPIPILADDADRRADANAEGGGAREEVAEGGRGRREEGAGERGRPGSSSVSPRWSRSGSCSTCDARGGVNAHAARSAVPSVLTGPGN
eukprot:986579-Rhodomonas_salina.1